MLLMWNSIDMMARLGTRQPSDCGKMECSIVSQSTSVQTYDQRQSMDRHLPFRVTLTRDARVQADGV